MHNFLYYYTLINKTMWHGASVCFAKQGTLYNTGSRRSLPQSLITCTQTNYTESSLSTLSEQSDRPCLSCSACDHRNAQYVCVFLHGLGRNRIPRPQLTVRTWVSFGLPSLNLSISLCLYCITTNMQGVFGSLVIRNIFGWTLKAHLVWKKMYLFIFESHWLIG